MGGVTIKATYGLDVAETDDPYIIAADKATQSLELLVVGSSLLEYFPFLARAPTWLPGTQFLLHLKEVVLNITKAREMPWLDGKKLIVRFPLALLVLA